MPTVPLDGYTPILDRVLTLALDYEPLSMRAFRTAGFGDDDPASSVEALRMAAHERDSAMETLANAVTAINSVRPSEPELQFFHETARRYASVMLRYHDASDAAFIGLMTAKRRSELDELERQKDHLEQLSEYGKGEMQERIRDLYHHHRGLFDRLNLSNRVLTELYLDDIVDDRSGHEAASHDASASRGISCVHCGTELPDDAAYCSKCGAPQRNGH